MSDQNQILEVHRRWWECNHTGDIPRMATCFAKGSANYLMFNLNGHTYYGIEEKVALWEWYAGRVAVGEPDVRILQFDIHGDTAWVAAEGIFPARYVSEPGSGSSIWQLPSSRYTAGLMRSTEVYRRDDGDGNPDWKIWHFHCSVQAPSDEIRPGFHDTGRQRGLGYMPERAPAHA